MFKRFFLSEKYIMAAIVLNAIVIFLLYFPQIEQNSPALHRALDILDHLFVLLFLTEAIVKIRVWKSKKYFADPWNIFDFIIVIVSIPSFLNFIPFFASAQTSFFKIFRLFRMIRLLRFARFIPNLESILSGLARALKASVFVLMVLFFLNFLLALFTCHFYGSLVPDYFGDPLISSYYIFQMFTIEGWNEIPDIIAEAAKEKDLANHAIIAGLTRFYFIIVVLFGGIFGMSLANAIFVDEMTMDNNKGVEDKIDRLEEQISELKEMLKQRQ